MIFPSKVLSVNHGGPIRLNPNMEDSNQTSPPKHPEIKPKLEWRQWGIRLTNNPLCNLPSKHKQLHFDFFFLLMWAATQWKPTVFISNQTINWWITIIALGTDKSLRWPQPHSIESVLNYWNLYFRQLKEMGINTTPTRRQALKSMGVERRMGLEMATSSAYSIVHKTSTHTIESAFFVLCPNVNYNKPYI